MEDINIESQKTLLIVDSEDPTKIPNIQTSNHKFLNTHTNKKHQVKHEDEEFF